MSNKFSDIVINNQDEIIQMWFNQMNDIRQEKYGDITSDDIFKRTNEQFVQVIFANIQQEHEKTSIEEFTEDLLQVGWPLSYITDGLIEFRKGIFNFILKHADQIDAKKFSQMIDYVDEWIDPIVHQLINEYTGSWEHILNLQRVALQELSAPLIPVIDKISVMPLVGAIDTDRATLIMENLLEGVITHHAEVVLLDITGVPVVDTMVAHHIVKAVDAVRLVGSTCILVGIRPEIAQTIVNLGINLEHFPTKSTLKKGFTTALEITNRKIVSLDQADKAIDELITSLK